MEKTSSDPKWPRNGEVHKGVFITNAKGERWVKFDNGYFLPEFQKGFKILFEEN